MKRLSLLLILGIIAISLLLPLNVPAQPANVLANGTKVVLDNGVEAIYLGKTAEGKHLWEATFGSPKYLDDLVTPIEARWSYDSKTNEWVACANLFNATVKDGKVTVEYKGKKMDWQPQFEVKAIAQSEGYASLLINDSINDYYIGNTLQWNYGNGITRNVRLIEGMLQEYYTIDALPVGDITIKSNVNKDAGFVWDRPIVAWDSSTPSEMLNLTVDGHNVTLTLDVMKEATFPITIDPDTTFTTSDSDGYIGKIDQATYTLARNVTSGDVTKSSTVLNVANQYNSAYGYSVRRSFVFFATASLPDGANITNATLRLYGQGDWSETDFNVSIREGMPTYPHDPLFVSDFLYTHYTSNDGGSFNTSGFVFNWNDITLTADGLGYINKAGTTKFALFSSRDYNANIPTNGTAGEQVGFYAREGGSTNAPKLVVTYEASTAPAINTNSATYITATTARLNSYLVNDGGEYCDVRFQYGNSTGNYTVNTTWINDTYVTGNSPYVNIENLTITTQYFFRVQARNTIGTTNGSELNFTTSSGMSAPDNLTAYPSSHSISLSWLKGTNSTNTMIRQQVGAYPTNYTNGKQVYFGTMSTATDTGLTPGTNYYYRGWAESGGVYEANYTEVMTTTYAGTGAGDVPDAPTTPSGWFGTPDYTNMADFPLYNMINDIADDFGMPRNSFWLFGALAIVAIVAMFIYRYTHSGIGAMIASSVLIVIFSIAFGVPLWIIAPIMVVAIGAFMALRRV